METNTRCPFCASPKVRLREGMLRVRVVPVVGEGPADHFSPMVPSGVYMFEAQHPLERAADIPKECLVEFAYICETGCNYKMIRIRADFNHKI